MPRTIDQLVATGRVSEALAQLRLLTHPSVEDRTNRCELEVLAANRDVAHDLANDVLKHVKSGALAARCLLVLARLDMYSGRASDGQLKFLRARDLALEAADPSLIAHSVGQHVEALLRYATFESAVAELGAYRRVALRAGNHRALATMHRVLAEAEIKSGRGHRAVKELELASFHAVASGDPVVMAHLHVAKSSTAGLLGDSRGASEEATKGLTLARTAGVRTLLRALSINVVYAQTLLGQFADAEASLASLTTTTKTSVDAELDAAGSALLLAVCRHDFDAADEIVRAFSHTAEGRRTGSADWYLLARLQFLAHRGQPSAATDAGLERLSTLERAHDVNLLGRVKIATAEAAALAGRHQESSQLLGGVAVGPLGHLPEFIAATQRVSGRLAHSPSAAFEHFARAARLFGHLGHMIGRAESRYAAAQLQARLEPASSPAAVVPPIATFYDPPPASFGRIDVVTEATPTTTSSAVARAVRGTAAMADLASRPVLAGYELLALAADSGAAATALLTVGSDARCEVIGWTGSDQPDESLRKQSTEAVAFDLGQDQGKDVRVVVTPASDPSARITLLAMQRVMNHGITLHRASVAESEKSAIWPEPLPEQQLGFVCVSESMLELLRVTRRVATSNIPVLITGETGTGKELLAQAVHQCSPRAKKTFLPFNCTAVPRDLLDAQLFGHRRGAFTGAHDASPGVIRSAAGGTLFLDEIGEIGLDVQPKLLRFLESSDVHPLGEPAPVNVDVRVVAATNANMARLVAEGKFREDLYYRLNVVTLTIPPLRERREEIPLLLDHFLARSQKESNKTGIRIGELAAEYLLLYNWPGNVRELANEVRRAVALAESGAVIMPEHLSHALASSRRTVPVGQRPPTPSELLVRRDQPLSAAVEHVERTLIQDAMRVHGSVEGAAKALGLSRKGLYLKRQRLKIEDEPTATE